jgi:membrane-associated phospholipid phosphatase
MTLLRLLRGFLLTSVLVVGAHPAHLRAQADGDHAPAAARSAVARSIDDALIAVRGDSITLEQQPAPPIPTPRHTGVHALVKELWVDVKNLPAKENLYWAAAGGALALAVHPLDDNVHDHFATSDTGKALFKPGVILGDTWTLLGVSTVVYATGRIKDEPRVSHVGMDLIRAIAISEGLVQGLKYTTRRERPDGSGKNSFPSGHASDTFAFATALERHLGWKYATPAYVFSSYVAMSRLPANRHWLSDVVFGSAVGIIAGRTVTGHEENKYPVEVTLVNGGAAILFVRRPPRLLAPSGAAF